MKIVTRFAPSPTGNLHIGGARTALFNFLYAKHNGGIFKLRVEDTDQKRSKKEFEESITEGMNWLGLQHDEETVYQSKRVARHVEVAQELLKKGHAYYCHTPLDEIQKKRAEFEAQGKVFQFQSEWRDRDPDPSKTGGVVRFKAPNDGHTTIQDLVQGRVTVPNSELDDMVMLRSDGTPTYMLAVVVDDYDMEVTHVIRGDDHLNNAFRQIHLYHAMGWDVPEYAHIPLIHGIDGAKLSKRHGALSVLEYQEKGYLPEAMFNYLLRMGWGHGNDEIISKEQAIEWFDIKNVNKSPAKLDFDKMMHLNGHYIKNSDNEDLISHLGDMSESQKNTLKKGLEGLKKRAKTLLELKENAQFYLADEPIEISAEAEEIIDGFDKEIYKAIVSEIKNATSWDEEILKELVKSFAEKHGMKLGQIAQVLRPVLTGSTVSPSIFEILPALGKEKSIERLSRFC
jgi:glutamyl-tRNA synthetase